MRLEKAQHRHPETLAGTDDGAAMHTHERAFAPAIVPTVHPALVATWYVRDHIRRDRTGAGVGYAIAAFVDDTGAAGVGLRTLAEHSGFNVATVNDTVHRLEAEGHLHVERTGRGSVYRFSTSRELLARSREPVARLTTLADTPAPREPVARSRDLPARSRELLARSVPGGGGTSTRDAEKPTTTDLAPHAVEAMELLEVYVIAETNNRSGVRNRLAYAATMRKRIRAELLERQAQYSTADELVATVTGEDLTPATSVAERLEAAWNLPAPTPDADDGEKPELFEVDHESARAAFARGLAEARQQAAS